MFQASRCPSASIVVTSLAFVVVLLVLLVLLVVLVVMLGVCRARPGPGAWWAGGCR
jgi:hypothetical protein